MELCSQCFSAPEMTPGAEVCSECYKKTTGHEPTEKEMKEKIMGVKLDEETGMPKFESFEEMQAFMKKTAKSKTPQAAAKTGTKKAKGRSPQKPEVSSETQLDDKNIYSEVHYFVRAVDSWEQILKDGREDRRTRNSNVLIFCHNHMRGEACIHLCREIV